MSAHVATPLKDLAIALAASGFREKEARVSESFGDQLTAYARGKLAIRSVRDRGQWFVEASPNSGEDWYDADVWRACLIGVRAPDEPRVVQEQARMLLLLLEVLGLLYEPPEERPHEACNLPKMLFV